MAALDTCIGSHPQHCLIIDNRVYTIIYGLMAQMCRTIVGGSPGPLRH